VGGECRSLWLGGMGSDTRIYISFDDPQSRGLRCKQKSLYIVEREDTSRKDDFTDEAVEFMRKQWER
jgi:hypothetical protein